MACRGANNSETVQAGYRLHQGLRHPLFLQGRGSELEDIVVRSERLYRSRSRNLIFATGFHEQAWDVGFLQLTGSVYSNLAVPAPSLLSGPNFNGQDTFLSSGA